MLVRTLVAQIASKHPDATLYIRSGESTVWRGKIQKFVNPGKDKKTVLALAEKPAMPHHIYDNKKERVVIDIKEGN